MYWMSDKIPPNGEKISPKNLWLYLVYWEVFLYLVPNNTLEQVFQIGKGIKWRSNDHIINVLVHPQPSHSKGTYIHIILSHVNGFPKWWLHIWRDSNLKGLTKILNFANGRHTLAHLGHAVEAWGYFWHQDSALEFNSHKWILCRHYKGK